MDIEGKLDTMIEHIDRIANATNDIYTALGEKGVTPQRKISKIAEDIRAIPNQSNSERAREIMEMIERKGFTNDDSVERIAERLIGKYYEFYKGKMVAKSITEYIEKASIELGAMGYGEVLEVENEASDDEIKLLFNNLSLIRANKIYINRRDSFEAAVKLNFNAYIQLFINNSKEALSLYIDSNVSPSGLVTCKWDNKTNKLTITDNTPILPIVDGVLTYNEDKEFRYSIGNGNITKVVYNCVPRNDFSTWAPRVKGKVVVELNYDFTGEVQINSWDTIKDIEIKRKGRVLPIERYGQVLNSLVSTSTWEYFAVKDDKIVYVNNGAS